MAITIGLKALALWFGILVLAVLNGTLREKAFIPLVGSFPAFIASGTILSVCIFLVAYLATPWYGALSSPQWLAIGLFWFLLTLAFEFGFGRCVQHKDWPELFEAYTFKGGNIWSLVLVVRSTAPSLNSWNRSSR